MYPIRNAPTERMRDYWMVSLEYNSKEYFKDDNEDDGCLDGRGEEPMRVNGKLEDE